jgi:predicted TIM-barrel fold metal-dependent hydrolase
MIRFFGAILERAEALQIPLYLHPTPPPQPVIQAYYVGNFAPEVSAQLAAAGWGWHIETAIYVIRIILSGAFDLFPNMQLVNGHMGEALPFMLPRLNRSLPQQLTKIIRPIGAYLRQNIYYTFTGFNFIPDFWICCCKWASIRYCFLQIFPIVPCWMPGISWNSYRLVRPNFAG